MSESAPNPQPEVAPAFDASGLPITEGPETFDVRDAWPAGEVAPAAQPPAGSQEGGE